MSGDNPDDFKSFLIDLIKQIQSSNHRYCIVVAGDKEWQKQKTRKILDHFADKQIRWISADPPANAIVIKTSKITNILGDETDVIVFDACSGFNPDIFGAVSGIIRGGGLLILLTPPLSEWAQFNDPEYERITVYPTPPEKMTGRFLARLVQVIQHHSETVIIEQKKMLPSIKIKTDTSSGKFNDPIFRSEDQKNAVEAIFKVSQGHRRRPLVITSDRGRGKTTALGIAAAQLMNKGVDHIIVTAPRRDALCLLFDHAASLLPDCKVSREQIKTTTSKLEFLPPDELIRNEHQAKLLLVDEAAAIPAPILEQLLTRYSRIVFATTIHGYEGTGRGFAVRFQTTLNEHTPNWKAMEMKTPVRWAENDPLENLVFESLLLDANPAPDELVITANTRNCSTERVDREKLVSDENSLKQLFGLLVTAHYQTRPSDLRYLLDGPNLSIFVLRHHDHIIATTLLAHEGDFNEAMAKEITAGKRRPHGHLIPETLASHMGLKQAPLLKGARVVRIAVHPAVQNHGLGSYLLDQIQKHPTISDLDYIATCFGATVDLLRFWKKADYLPIRVGLQRNASSGEHSVVLFKPISKKGNHLLVTARERFFRQFPHQLADSLQDLEPDIVAFLLQQNKKILPQLDEMDWEDFRAFIRNERVYETCPASILDFVCSIFMNNDAVTLNNLQRDVVIRKVLQKNSWENIARIMGLSGKKEIVQKLQEALNTLYLKTNIDSVDNTSKQKKL